MYKNFIIVALLFCETFKIKIYYLIYTLKILKYGKNVKKKEICLDGVLQKMTN